MLRLGTGSGSSPTADGVAQGLLQGLAVGLSSTPFYWASGFVFVFLVLQVEPRISALSKALPRFFFFLFTFEIGSCYVTLTGLEFEIFLPQPSYV